MRRFTRASVQHPTYAALAELGKVIKIIFLCSYLRDPAVRREVHEGLQVVENWNSANTFIHYGKGGEIATNRLDDQEVSVLCMALIQNALCLIWTGSHDRCLFWGAHLPHGAYVGCKKHGELTPVRREWSTGPSPL